MRFWKSGFIKKIIADNRGFSLIEVLLATVIISTVGAGLLAGLTLASKVVISTDQHETARDLAVAEMEYIKSQSYNSSRYDCNAALVPSGSGLTVTVVNPPESIGDSNLQKITIIVNKNGQEITRLAGYKVNW
jgi:prepilin-type N-terminal cleavage/methylation domain-containing protein